MSKRRYIHNYERILDKYKEKLNKVNISKKNKELISNFDRDCSIKENIEVPTRTKYYDVLLNLSINYTKKDFDKLTKKDYENIIEKIKEREEISISTKQKYYAIIKKFGRWIAYGDKIFNGNGIKTYPETVEWINTTIKAKDKPKVKASDILTEEEINRLIEAVDHPRDKAFLSALYETGARIGEIGNIRIKDITEDPYGYLIDLSKGKTGERNVRVVFSSSKLAQWLNQHPGRDNPNSYVWIVLLDDHRNKKIRGEPIEYAGLVKILKRAMHKANLNNKRVYPHLFRHSRVTHLLANKQINESQAKVYFGWTPNSDMLARYSHLTSKDVNDTMLQINGIKPMEETTNRNTRLCISCKKPNSIKDSFCGFCGRPMDFKILMSLEDKKKLSNKIKDTALLKGLDIDKAIEEILNSKIEKRLNEMKLK